MAEVKPSASRGEDAVELVGEASCSGADRSSYAESIPSAIAAESPSFLTRIWIRIKTACSGARGGGLLGSRVLGRASGAQQQTQEASESEVLSRIAASQSTWSEVPGRDIRLSVPVPCPDQLSVWEELKASAPRFFRDYEDAELQVGRQIAEGGQAQIFEAKVRYWSGDHVLKVFKLDSGFSLADLKCHWPRSMSKEGEDCSDLRSMQERRSGFVFENVHSNIYGDRCVIVGATLLKDGRFAFLMVRYWGDLRTLIDLQVNGNTHPWMFCLPQNRRAKSLFSFGKSIWIMLQIARGMKGLHALGVLHRDLKAANVLIRAEEVGAMKCDVADYECAMFVQGTGFWRAPEVLQELQKNEEDRSVEIWIEKVDVYSFEMTCYEILTGQIPFDGYTKSKWGDVIRGERPFLPHYVYPQLRVVVEACWHAEPSQRPSFDAIVDELESIAECCLGFVVGCGFLGL